MDTTSNFPSPTSPVLATLRDLSGVTGSFAIAEPYGLVARDMPAMFTDDLLDEIAPRVLRLVDTFANDETEVHAYLVRFREHLLFLRATRSVVLCVLSTPDVNLPALRMGANLAVRRLAQLVAAPPPPPPPPTWPAPVWPAPPPPPAPAAAPAPRAPAAPAAAPAPTTMQWRGGTLPPRR